ncbi:MAG: carboxypeptidase regulatory-like domain-containing protein, partial [Planctomycetota bacterium]
GQALPTKPDREPVTSEPSRVEVTDADQSGKDYPQGIEGQLVDKAGYGVPGAKVYLMPGLGVKHAFELMRQHSEGRIFLPVAQTVSDENGKFMMGIERVEEGKVYEVRVIHTQFCDHKLPNIQFLEGDKVNVGRVTLKRGVVVEGRVMVKGTNYPVAEATVSIGNPNSTINIAPVPGRENGITAEVDASGHYRIENVDPVGIFKMTALAPDYSKEEKTDISLELGAVNRVDFELSPGFSIAGIITGPTGKPVPYAKITAYALSQKVSQTEETRTDQDGKFEVLGLQQGSFTIVAEAPGFVKGEDKPIPAGKKDVHIVLEKQGMVTVQVFSKSGSPLRSYQVWLKTHFDGQEIFGNTNVYKKVERSPTGTTTLEGIDPMDYVVEVQAKGHAKAYSEPFKIVASQQEVPKITVRMDEGGVIAGVLVNGAGQPIAGATVKTRPNKLIDNPLVEMFQVPYRITKTQVSTNKNGEFRINLLNDGLYQLRFIHRDYCTLTTNNTKVIGKEVTDIGQVRLVQGALLTGVVRVNGVPRGQVKVAVSSVADAQNPSPAPFSCEAITDNQGTYILSKRLPPGSYEAYAAEQIQNNPFLMIVQMQKSKKSFRVPGNRKFVQLDINLAKN